MILKYIYMSSSLSSPTKASSSILPIWLFDRSLKQDIIGVTWIGSSGYFLQYLQVVQILEGVRSDLCEVVVAEEDVVQLWQSGQRVPSGGGPIGASSADDRVNFVVGKITARKKTC